MKFLFVTDSHITKATPKYRTPTFYADIMAKWREVFSIAKERNVNAVLHGGDLYHNDNPDVEVIVDTMKAIDRDLYLTVGNHDFRSNSWLTLANTTALGLMDYTNHIKIPKEDLVFDVGGKKVLIRFGHYFERDDPNRFKVKNFTDYALVIMIVHDALVNEPVQFKHLLVTKLKPDADVVLCGHYHIPFKYQSNRTLFLNPGSMVRLTRLPADMERMPQVVYLEFDGVNFQYEMIPLASAVPWEKAFQVEQIKQDVIEEVDLAKEFMSAIQANIGSLNVEETLTEVAKNENIDDNVIELCKKYIRKVM